MRKKLVALAALVVLIFTFVSCEAFFELFGITDPADIQAIDVIFNDDDGTITLRVYNAGSDSLTDVEVWILLSTDAFIDKNDDHVHTVYVTVGGTLTGITTFDASALDLTGIADGSYYVGIYVDPNKLLSGETATNNTIASSMASFVIANEDTTAPADVSDLTAAAGDGQVTLSWTDPADEDLDRIEITRTGTGGSTPVVVDPGDESAIIDGLTNGVTYTFTVVSVDTSDNASAGEIIAEAPEAGGGGTAAPVVQNAIGTGLTTNSSVALTQANLNTTDADSTSADITYTVNSYTPGGGELQLMGGTLDPTNTFTQAELNAGSISYANTNGNPGPYDVELSVQDESGNFAATSPFTLTFTVSDPGGAAPVLSIASGFSLDTNSTAIVTTSDLQFTDADTPDWGIIYFFVSASPGVELRLLGAALTSGESFAQQDITDANIEIANVNGIADNYDVLLDVEDNDANPSADAPVTLTFTVSVAGTSAPVVDTASGFSVYPFDVQYIEDPSLSTSDADSAASDITYALLNIAPNAEIRVFGSPISVGGTFTQQDILDLNVQFADIDGTGGTYDVELTVEDETGNVAAASPITLTFTVFTPPEVVNAVGLNVAANDSVVLGTNELLTTDADTVDSEIYYMIDSYSSAGIEMRLYGGTLFTGGDFNQQDVIDGAVEFANTNGIPTIYEVILSIQDGTGLAPAASPVTLTFNVTVPPVVINAAGFTMDASTSVQLTLADLSASDADSPDSEIYFALASVTAGFQVVNTTAAPLIVGNYFSQQDLINGNIEVQDLDGTGGTYFVELSVEDDDLNIAATSPVTLQFDVNPPPQGPVVVNASGFPINAGTQSAIGSASLLSTDADSSDSDIIYTFISIDAGVELRNMGAPISPTATFTQQEVNDLGISFADVAGTGGTYDVVLSVQDESANFAAASPVTLTFTVDPPPPVLVAEYLFTAGSASYIVDSSGNGNHGTLVGATPAADRFGNNGGAFHFDGTSFIDVGNDASLQFTDAITIAGWIKPEGGWQNGRIVSNRSGADGYEVDLWDGLRFARGGTNIATAGIGGHSVGDWIFFTVTWRPAAATPNGAIYMDAVEDVQIWDSVGMTLSPVNVFIGTYASDPGNPTWGFVGAIDDVRIYQGTLDPSAINALFTEADPYVPPTAISVATTGSDTIGSGHLSNPFATIQMGVDEAAALGLSEVRVQQGTYNVTTPAVMVEGVNLYGGFDSTGAWSPSLFVTTIQDTAAAGTVWSQPSRAVDVPFGVSSATSLYGFTINGSVAGNGFTAGVRMAGSATIENNIINGGDGSGGIDDRSYGIFVSSGNPVIRRNDINGGNNENAYAIWIEYSTGQIERNKLNGGSGTNTYGIRTSYSGEPSVINNLINGGAGTAVSSGIMLSGNTATVSRIFNNTIAGGNGPRGTSYGIEVGGSSTPRIINNIIFHLAGATALYGVKENDASSQPLEFRNNDITSVNGLYVDATNGTLTSAAAVNANGSEFTDNFSVNPLLADAPGGDWHLSGASAASSGGLNLSGEGYSNDFDLNSRTAPWSMGAYEFD